MLVPLLALPVARPAREPPPAARADGFAASRAVVLLARHVARRARLAARGRARGGARCSRSRPAPWLFEYLGDQPYGLSLALALAGARASPEAVGRRTGRGARRAARRRGSSSSSSAHWVNAAAGLVLLPLAARPRGRGPARGRGRGAEVARAPRASRRRCSPRGSRAGQLFLRLYPRAHRQAACGSRSGRSPLERLPERVGDALRERVARRRGAGGSRSRRSRRAGVRAPLARGRCGPHLAGALAPRRRAPRRRARVRALRGLAPLGRGERVPLALPRPVGGARPPRGGLAPRRAARAPAAARAPGRRALALALVPRGGARGLRRAVARARARGPRRGRRGAHRGRARGRLRLVAGDYWTVWPAVWHAALVATRARARPARVRPRAPREPDRAASGRGAPREALRILPPRRRGGARGALAPRLPALAGRGAGAARDGGRARPARPRRRSYRRNDASSIALSVVSS